MLSKNEMVKTRRVIEALYEGTCTITEHQKFQKPNKSVGFREEVVLEKQPCRLSFSTINQSNQTETGASSVSQTVKLFIAPEIQVKPGSKITVTQNGVTTDYKNSGEPAYYSTHQEIILELFKGWA